MLTPDSAERTHEAPPHGRAARRGERNCEEPLRAEPMKKRICPGDSCGRASPPPQTRRSCRSARLIRRKRPAWSLSKGQSLATASRPARRLPGNDAGKAPPNGPSQNIHQPIQGPDTTAGPGARFCSSASAKRRQKTGVISSFPDVRAECAALPRSWPAGSGTNVRSAPPVPTLHSPHARSCRPPRHLCRAANRDRR